MSKALTPRQAGPAARPMGRHKKTAAERRKKYGLSMAQTTMKAIEKEAKKDNRSVSAMAETLILEGLSARNIGGKK